MKNPLNFYNPWLILLIALSAIGQPLDVKSQALSKSAYEKATAMIRQGVRLVANGKADSAAVVYEMAQGYAIDHKLYDLVPVTIVEKSRLFAYQDKYQEALKIIMDAKPYFDQHKEHPYAGDFFSYLGSYYYGIKSYQLALANFGIAEEIRSNSEPTKNWRTYMGMARVYNALKDYDTAESYAHKAEKLAKIQATNRLLKDMENNLVLGNNNATIRNLGTENKIVRFNLIEQKWKNQIFLIVLIFLALLLVALMIIHRQRNRILKEVNEKNNIIGKSLEEKDFLIREIHHRVKNNLQVISSLLSLQSRMVDDDKAALALNEGQNRVLSMALIHQNLYKDSDASEIEMKSYLTNLANNLFNTYNIDKEKVKLSLVIEPLLLDVGTLVPLGLIINELVANALKYAFADGQAGELRIELQKVDNVLQLVVADNGKGYDAAVQSEGFGAKLIDTFVRKLDAEITKKTTNGTSVCLRIKNYKLIA